MLKEDFFFNKFENEDFQFCSVNWWPFIKIQVAYQIHLKNINAFTLNKIDCNYTDAKIELSFKEKINFYYQKYRICKSIKNIIVTDSKNKTIYDEKFKSKINPYTDPFIDLFDKFKYDYSIFDISLSGLQLGFNVNSLRKGYLEIVRSEFDADKKIQIQILKLSHFLKDNYGEDFDLQNHLVNNLIYNQANYLVFLKILKKTKAKNILLYCYYNNTMMSFIRAANKLKLKTVEYQHSQVTSNHLAYSNWKIDKNNIQDFFPSSIWVWRKTDAEYLANQFLHVKKINYLIGGNLYLNSFKRERIKLQENQIKILITLQGIGIPDYIISVLDDFPNLIFYIRLHPRYMQDREMIYELKNKKGEQIEIEKANSNSLYDLFNVVDYHLTCFSGSAIEAEYFNLTNIIFGEKGYKTYQREIEDKKYFFIKNNEDLKVILQNRKKNNHFIDNELINTNDLIIKNFS